jgi:hypothetical protein
MIFRMGFFFFGCSSPSSAGAGAGAVAMWGSSQCLRSSVNVKL